MKEKLYIQIYKKLKSDILSGALYAGAKLPSKRQCARAWGASVITVENAYALLVDEGFVVPRERSGYYVAGLFVTGARPLSRIIMGISNRPFRRMARKKDFLPFPVSWKKEMMA